MLKAQGTVLEIDLKALKHNVEFLKSRLQPHTKFLAVVKAFAYGSDSIEIAKTLEELQVDYFAVAYVSEGIVLREAGITTPILVLHPVPEYFETMIAHCLEPSLYSHRVLEAFIAVAENKKQTHYPVHLKFNTGLNRLGFSQIDCPKILSTLENKSAIKVTSLFSHLAASEDLNEKQFTIQQIETFKTMIAEMASGLGYTPMLHQCNTSGILNYPQAHFDMVRSGIGMYGFGNDPKFNPFLKPIATLKTTISQIHTLEKGDSLGYNRALIATKTLQTATLPIGHADGITRAYGNKKGYVIINKQKAYIVGNVCMDMIMVDVTEIDCNEGDEAIVFGPHHTAEHFSETIGSISYEILTAISQRVKRVFKR